MTTPPEESTRIMLRDDVERDDVDDAMCEHGWNLVNIVPAADSHPTQLIFLSRNRRNLIYYVRDERINACYFIIRGPSVGACAEEVRKSLATYSEDEIRAMFAPPPADANEYIRALYYASLTSNVIPTDDLVEKLRVALEHPDKSVRKGALSAMTALRGTTICGLMEVSATADPDEGLRGFARNCLTMVRGQPA